MNFQGSRVIQSLSYDPARRIVYWVDRGSKKSHCEDGQGRFSIRRAFDNGTLAGRRLQGCARDDDFRPLDLAVDPVNRLLFWSNGATGALSINRLFDEDEEAIGVVAGGRDDRTTKIAMDYHKG